MCYKGDLGGVRAALASWEDGEMTNVNTGNEKNFTGLMASIYAGHNEVVEVLLKQSSLDVNTSDSHGITALHWATAWNNVTGLKMLLADPRLTSVNARRGNGLTPLMSAINGGSVECVRELVREKGVDLDTRNDQGRRMEEVARWVKCLAMLATFKISIIRHA